MFLKLKNSEYAKNSIILIVGTGLAQLIPILLQPILRRIYTAEEFGVFAQFYSIVSILTIVSNLRYANSILIPKSDKESLGLLSGSIILNFISSILIYIILFFIGSYIFNLMGLSEELNKYIWVIPISVFFISTNLTFNFWLTRKKRYKGMSVNKGVRRISEGGMQIVFHKALSKGGLIYGTIIGDFLNLIMFYFQFKNSEGSFKEINKSTITGALKNQSEFPKYSLLPALLDVISLNLPIFIISAIYSKSIVGQFDGSRQLLAVPLALISISLSQVLYQKLTEQINNNQKIMPIIKKNFLFLLVLSVVGIFIFYFFGVPIFTLFFGEKWVLAGQISTILVFSYGIRFLISPLSIVFFAIKKLKISAIWQVLYFGIMLCLLLFKDFTIETFIFYFVLLDVFSYLIYGVLIYFTVKNKDKEMLN